MCFLFHLQKKGILWSQNSVPKDVFFYSSDFQMTYAILYLEIVRVEKIPHTIKMGTILHEDRSPRQYDKSDKPRDQTATQIGSSGKVSNV